MDVLLAGNEPSLWKGPLPALNVQRHYLWKSFRAESNTIPGSTEKCSASARNPVRLHPGIVFGINPECCSPSPRKPVRLGPESAGTLNERHYRFLLSGRHRESIQCRFHMPQKRFPVFLGDPHPFVRNFHVPACVVDWPTRALTEEVDQQLLLSPHSIFAAVSQNRPSLSSPRVCSSVPVVTPAKEIRYPIRRSAGGEVKPACQQLLTG